jgi:signal transduction histidine kinase
MKYVSNLFQHYKNYYVFGRLAHLHYAGIVGSVGYPLFYLIYLKILHQPYENLGIRLTATIGCAIVALKSRWPEKFQPYFLAFSYWSILFCLPFFHVFMALKNHGGPIMTADSFMAVFFLVLLTDWRNTLMMIFIGTVAATILYLCTTENPSIPLDYLQRLPTFILVVIGGSLFKFSERQVAEKLEQEKLHGMSTVLATVAHEMRTPLLSISAGTRGLQRYVAMLIAFYEKHQDVANPTEKISPKHLAMTVPTIDLIQGEAKYMNSAIDLLLANVVGASHVHQITRVDINKVLENTLKLYPFESEKQRASVWVSSQEPVMVDCNEDLLRMIMVNLIKNALRAIARGRKGELQIAPWMTEHGARLSIRDTGCGIPAAQLPSIFKRFYSYPPADGTGIGLAFCHDTLALWGAKISCTSEEGNYTEFIIEFPLTVESGVVTN